MRLHQKLVGMFLLGLLATFVQAQANEDKKNPHPQDQSSPQSANTADNSQVRSLAGPDYVIGADDVLKISVWKETDISNSLPVRPDGKISLALLGDIQAAGLTPTQLGMNITEKLRKYISDPRVTVVVTAINSRKVFILGEVQHTGAYPLLPNMTVLQALSSAGGFSQFANLKGIYVLRNENGTQHKLPFNYREVIKGKDVKDNIVLKPGDTIVVP